ncbi:MAG TPA: VCBS repeat-containing protein [Usitatibacteraceae bacterium]|nr:VCBS repeat-containing protein [Usitatibacteraceae bacterium]
MPSWGTWRKQARFGIGAAFLLAALGWSTAAWAPPVVIDTFITVHFTGNGTGEITLRVDDRTLASCREDCRLAYTNDTMLGLQFSLAPVADPASRFLSWTGCTPGTAPDSCLPILTNRQCLTSPSPFLICAYGSVEAAFRRVPAGDVDGDAKADLFWRQSAGDGVSWWTMDGAAVTGGNYLAAGPEWQLKMACDLTGDGKADLVWQRPADGFVHLWALDGLAVTAFADVGPVDPAQWSLSGCGDLDRDGKADLLWRDEAGGSLYAWLMDGGAIKAQGSPGAAEAAWQVAGVADLDRDGRDDIVWRHSATGEAYAWFMNGLAIASQRSLGTLDPASWTLAWVADFDGNGHADLLWRHATGDTWAWLMRAGTFVSGASLGTPGPEWSDASVADRDADGKADIAWRHADGSLWLWKVDGLAVTSQAPMPDPGAGWQVAAP